MKALVTGSTGFIGSRLCSALLEKGFEVRAFHRPSSPLRGLEGLNVEHALGDLTQIQSISASLKDIDVIFHVGGITNSYRNPERLLNLIIDGTRNVIQAAVQCKIGRLVYTSSVAALGLPESSPGGDSFPVLLNENHSWNTNPENWVYGYAKYMAEVEIQKAVARGFDAVIVNPSVVIGAGDLYRQTSSIIVNLAHRKIPALIEGGVNVVHINDVTAGHIAAFERGRRGQRYILGGENLTIRQLIQQISEIAHAPVPSLTIPTSLVKFLNTPLRLMQTFVPLPISADLLHQAGRYFFYDIHKAQVDLGVFPSHSTKEAIEEAYTWFKGAGAIR